MESIQVRTADGVRLFGMHVTVDRGIDDGREKDLAIVLAHGFTVSVGRPHLQRVAQRFARAGDVVMADFRGHGRSAGGTSAGDFEVLDLDAVVRWARDAGYRRVATVGFSMGAGVVIRHAALAPTSSGLRPVEPVDAAVSVSAPSRWYIRDTVPMRRVHWLLETPSGHWVAEKALRTRIAGVWGVPPDWPVAVVGRIAPTPLLLLQGDQDPYFGAEHGRALAAAAGPSAEYWELAGFGHAEGALTPALVDRIAGWVATSVGRAGTMRQ
ncbi:MAG TPA: alpha/beta fold hydrolase [Mycobacteriales bacterium]|nr:alpha/beta fold hydrolase [Mycobacteriales bacterium]